MAAERRAAVRLCAVLSTYWTLCGASQSESPVCRVLYSCSSTVYGVCAGCGRACADPDVACADRGTYTRAGSRPADDLADRDESLFCPHLSHACTAAWYFFARSLSRPENAEESLCAEDWQS